MTEANARVLNQQLKELENHGIIYKKIFPTVPPKVEYYLTDIGRELIPLFQVMEEWGNSYSKKHEKFDSPTELNGFHTT